MTKVSCIPFSSVTGCRYTKAILKMGTPCRPDSSLFYAFVFMTVEVRFTNRTVKCLAKKCKSIMRRLHINIFKWSQMKWKHVFLPVNFVWEIVSIAPKMCSVSQVEGYVHVRP